MHFEIDGKRYVVTISPRPLRLDGEIVQSRIDERGFIQISDQVSPHERRRILLHELRHAWVFARGRTVDDEADADESAEMMDIIMEQYHQQGGDTVIESLSPEPDSRIMRQSRGPGVQLNAVCGQCSASIAVGSVHNGPPEWSVDLGGWQMARGAWCEICDACTVWTEACSTAGTPLGTVLSNPAPNILRGAAAGRWIAKHGDSRVYVG